LQPAFAAGCKKVLRRLNQQSDFTANDSVAINQQGVALKKGVGGYLKTASRAA
jgi:hypothetical protein